MTESGFCELDLLPERQHETFLSSGNVITRFRGLTQRDFVAQLEPQDLLLVCEAFSDKRWKRAVLAFFIPVWLPFRRDSFQIARSSATLLDIGLAAESGSSRGPDSRSRILEGLVVGTWLERFRLRKSESSRKV